MEQAMALTDLLSQLDQLDRDDKLRVIDHLMDILEKESAEEPSADDAVEAARDDAHWEASFARSQDVLARMAARTRQNRDRGLNQELDPDKL
jgi:hypothetical protein